MKDLRARLAQIAAQQADGGTGQAPAPVATPRGMSHTCFVRETAVPLSRIFGDMLPDLSLLPRIDAAFGRRCERIPPLERLLFLDTETTGLGMGAGTVAFLLGLGWVEGDAFVVRQLMMRDYPEEPLQMAAFEELLSGFVAFVTYNGKSFDLPLLENRLTMQRMRHVDVHLPHLDLLYPARRVWRMRLTDCKLSNIEARILGCGRVNDLPGSEVPERFFRYLKTGEFALLEDVLHHNLLDIQTLGKLLAKLVQVFTVPEQQDFFEDVFSVGRALARDGQREMARACFRVASVGDLAEQARTQLALSHRRDRQYTDAEAVYTAMAAQGQGGLMPYVELAKLAEHHRRDLPMALRHTEAALERVALREQLGRPPDPEVSTALHMRRARLLRKLQART